MPGMDWLTTASEDQLKLYLALVGVAGGVVGGLIGFLSNQVATTRQIRRQERDKRREVYSRYLHGVVRIRNLMKKLRELRMEVDLLTNTARSALIGRQVARLSEINEQTEELKSRFQEYYDRVHAEIENSLLHSYDMRLYAPWQVRRAAFAIDECMAREPDTVELDRAMVELRIAEARFISCVRADVRAVDAPSRFASRLRASLNPKMGRFARQ